MKEPANMNQKGEVNMTDNKLVIGLAGMPGSGKSLAVTTAKEMGYSIIVMGDVIRQETKSRGLELTPENVGRVMIELRKENGDYVIAHRCIPKIKEQTSSKVLVDGLRSLHEAEIFKQNFEKFSLLAVYASPQTRFHRLVNRGRSDDTSEWQVFHERDMRELDVGLGNVIVMAEEMVINNIGIEPVKVRIREAIKRIEKKWIK